MTSYSTMPAQTNGGVYPSSIPGHEYGITNVSSHGRVNITVIPPNKLGRQLSPAPAHAVSPGSSHSSHQRFYSSSSSPKSPLPIAGNYNDNNSNNVRTSHKSTTVHSTAQYNPPANRGGQLLQPAAPTQPSGKEQSDLDEILRELLGESHTSTTTTTRNEKVVTAADDSFVRERQQYTNPDGSTTTIEKRKYKAPNVTENVTINKTSSRKMHTTTQNGTSGGVGGGTDIDSSGMSWLQQQQMKLNQRQRTLDDVDSGADGQTYYSQKDIIVNQQPVAYTVLIKPEEEKRRQEEVRQQNETNLSKKSVTNVSHTHHTHYNFKDADDGAVSNGAEPSQMLQTLEEQRNKIKQLEDELRNVKMGLQQTNSYKREEERKVEKKPPRPPKQEIEEEEVLSFKPVGIASLESGTGATMPRVITGPAPGVEEEETLAFRPVGVNTLDSGTGQSFAHTNTMRSGSEGRTLQGAQNGAGFGTVGSYGGTIRSQPQSPENVEEVKDEFDFGTGVSMGGPQRVVTESRHVQHSYAQGGQQMGAEASSPMYNQGMQMANEDAGAAHGTMGGGNQRYGYSTSQSYHSGMNQAGQSGTLPHNQALHINTGENRYATVGGQQTHSSGHVQMNGGEHSDVFGHTENGHVTAKFVKDTSKYWYKPTISRDEVINQLKDAVPGTFIVRDSNSFPGAFGLAVRVHQLPPNVQSKGGNDSSEYVRFYLIEPTAKGVKLKGCSNEPVFASLAALIYQHTITPLALPCKLLLPDPGFSMGVDHTDGAGNSPAVNGDMSGSASELLKHGAACKVVYLSNVDTESLTGPQAISRAVHQTFTKGTLDTTVATFKVSSEGITVTDTNHRLFFRQHFPKESISFCGADPADRRFTQNLDTGDVIKEAKMFGFVAKKKKGGNHCLLFAELDPEQPASAIVNFVTKVMMNNK